MRQLYIIFLFFELSLQAQNPANCAQSRLKEYIIDGRPYQLVLKGSDRGKIYFSFLNAFNYRVAICSPANKKYEIALYDIQKKLLFSGTCDDYTKVLDLSFESNIAGYFEIICKEQQEQNPSFDIVIGFKEKKDQQHISNKKE